MAGRILTAAAFDLPADYNSTYPDKIRSVTAAQVKAMAQQYLSTERLRPGSRRECFRFSRCAEGRRFRMRSIMEIPFDQLDVLAPDLRKAKQ